MKTLLSAILICVAIKFAEPLYIDLLNSSIIKLTIDFGVFMVLYYLISLMLKLDYYGMIKPLLIK